MSRLNDPPRTAAKFHPIDDNYYAPQPPPAPDVVSPAPRRIQPEVPGQIHDSLAGLELNNNDGRIWNRSPAPNSGRGLSPPNPANNGHFPAQTSPRDRKFSPFPKIRNRTSNIPQSYEEREATIENARPHVLQSSDADMQLAWAQDALTHVEICSEYEQRIATFQDTWPSTPPVERQMRIDAVNIVSFLAEQQHPRADFIKGMWLEFGKLGFAQDKPEAFRCFKRAASKGYARAEYRIGLQYESTGEYIKALQYYKAGEVLGDAAACYRMGMMSLTGQLGQAQDYENAIRLIKQAAMAADENAPQGAYVLGMLQARELPDIKVPESLLPIDLASARVNVEKAAFLGFAKAQLKMGSAYETCLFGCEFDPVLSLHYNALAARQSEPEAEMAISKWFLCGHEGSFPKDEGVAFQYAQRAAVCSDLPTAQFAMGYFYEIGLSVHSNKDTAVQWYEKAAKNGNKDAAGRLNAISKSGTLSRKDHEDVAVSRIKSQYGSRRGGPPPRASGAMQNSSMPTIPDERTSYSRPQQQAPPPGRTTPYPLDDRPPIVAPYPTDDEYHYRAQRPEYGPTGGFPAADQHPYSASGDAPQYYRQPRPAPGPQRQSPQLHPGQIPSPRPPNAYGSPNGSPSGGQGQWPYQRPPNQAMEPGRLTPQGYRPQGAPPSPRPPGQRTPSPQPGRADIGYSAPIDQRADYGNRPPPAGPTSGPQRLDPRAGTPGAPSPRPSGPSGFNGAASRPNNTASAAPQRPSTTATSTPSSNNPALSKPTQPKPPDGKRPSGAQTFEEMGVPSGKQDHDCVVM